MSVSKARDKGPRYSRSWVCLNGVHCWQKANTQRLTMQAVGHDNDISKTFVRVNGPHRCTFVWLVRVLM